MPLMGDGRLGSEPGVQPNTDVLACRRCRRTRLPSGDRRQEPLALRCSTDCLIIVRRMRRTFRLRRVSFDG
jgi:hypothetical protein